MPKLVKQAEFQRWPKPNFCYLCGLDLKDGSALNDDHCPPKGMFAKEDRANYPITLQVHALCNHKWHSADETMAIFLDKLHNTGKATKPGVRRKLHLVDIKSEQGVYQGITKFPILPLAKRIIRCMHAALYGEFLPKGHLIDIYCPFPYADTENGNRPVKPNEQTYHFANTLCTTQRVGAFDEVCAYNGKFRYVCAWDKFDNGEPICLFAFDIYRLHNFAVKIAGYPKAVIGYYKAEMPDKATRCSEVNIQHSDEDILYPLL
jgi:hypothetical protein